MPRHIEIAQTLLAQAARRNSRCHDVRLLALTGFHDYRREPVVVTPYELTLALGTIVAIADSPTAIANKPQ